MTAHLVAASDEEMAAALERDQLGALDPFGGVAGDSGSSPRM